MNNGTHKIWPEAQIIADPVKGRERPTVLVRRRHSGIVSPDADTEPVYFEGHPAISLFTGCGGMDLGLERTGFITVAQHEWDSIACQTLIANRPRYFRHAALIQGDIRKTTTGMILREAGLRVGECHLLTGGPPCQGFSTASTKACKGIYDQRNDLVFEFLRVVAEAKPHFFLFENVPGFVRFNNGDYLKRFLQAAHDCYYELVYGLANAVEYGVPQDRCRFLCMGTRRDLFEIENLLGSLPKPQNFGKRDLRRLSIIQDKPAFADEYQLLTHAPGVRYFPDRPVICNPDPTGHNDGRATGFLEFFRKLEANEPDRVVREPQCRP